MSEDNLLVEEFSSGGDGVGGVESERVSEAPSGAGGGGADGACREEADGRREGVRRRGERVLKGVCSDGPSCVKEGGEELGKPGASARVEKGDVALESGRGKGRGGGEGGGSSRGGAGGNGEGDHRGSSLEERGVGEEKVTEVEKGALQGGE